MVIFLELTFVFSEFLTWKGRFIIIIIILTVIVIIIIIIIKKDFLFISVIFFMPVQLYAFNSNHLSIQS